MTQTTDFKRPSTRFPRFRFLFNFLFIFLIAIGLSSMFRSQANLRSMIEDIYAIANKLEGQQLRERTIRVREISQRKKDRENGSNRGETSVPHSPPKTSIDSREQLKEKSVDGPENGQSKKKIEFKLESNSRMQLEFGDQEIVADGKQLQHPLVDLLMALDFLIFLSCFLLVWFYTKPISMVLKGQASENQNLQAQKRVFQLQSFHLKLFLFLSIWYYLQLTGIYYLSHASFPWHKHVIILSYSLCFFTISSAMVLTWMDSFHLGLVPLIVGESRVFEPKIESQSISLHTKHLALILVCSVFPLTFGLIASTLSSPFLDELTYLLFTDFQYISNKHVEVARIFPQLLPVFFQLAIFGFSITATFVLARNFSSGVIKPLDNLIEKMKKVSRGEYEEYTTVFSNDEIGQLKSHFNSMLHGLQQKEMIRDTFGRYMGKEISDAILAEGQFDLGGKSTNATVLFCDICGFTTMSEEMSAQEVVSLLNEMFAEIVDPINEEGGVVNKYIGDCIMALFGTPLSTPDHSERAVKAALGMLEKMKSFNENRLANGKKEVSIGIGIHSGELVCGNIGAPHRMEYTVIGDTVNVAARVESKTRELDCNLLISSQCYEGLSDDLKKSQSWKKFENIEFKGKSGNSVVYGLGGN